jgi:hypothetical protein
MGCVMKQPCELAEWVSMVHWTVPSTLHYLQETRELWPEASEVESLASKVCRIGPQEQGSMIRARGR